MLPYQINDYLWENRHAFSYEELAKATGLTAEGARGRIRYMRKQQEFLIPEHKGIDSIFLNDIHFPYADEETLKNVMTFIAEKNPATILLNGDIIDFYTLSRFDKDPVRLTHLQHDLDRLDRFLKDLRKIAPEAVIHYT